MGEPNDEKRRYPAESRIRRHWAQTDLWWRKGFDSPQELMEPGSCFACGFIFHAYTGHPIVQRAHILARSEGGQDAPENLHMLCRQCHKDSEYLSGERYWSWFWTRTPVDALVSAGVSLGMSGAALLFRGEIVMPEGEPAPETLEHQRIIRRSVAARRQD